MAEAPITKRQGGIRQRLYLAVGAIASFALISAVTGWVSLSRLDRAITTVTDEGLDQISVLTELNSLSLSGTKTRTPRRRSSCARESL